MSAVTMNPPSTESTPSTSRVIRQLARFEGRRQLRSPFLWLAVLASLGLVWLAVNDQPATLWARSVTIAGSCLPIAIVTLLLGNAAALRDHVSRVGETTDAPPTSRDIRVLGLVAGAWAALLLAVAVVIFGVALSVRDDPAGSFIWPELAVGPLLVLLGQALGVALGRWIPNSLAAPLTLIFIAGLFLVQDFWPGARTIPAASAFLPWRKAYILDWVQGEPRLPWLHIVYLLALVGTLIAVAARRWKSVLVAGIALIGVSVGLAGIPTAGEEVSAAVDSWAESQPRICEDHGGVQYCAIAGYQPWIDDWAAVVDRVQGLLPVASQLEAVDQTTSGGTMRSDIDPTVAYVRGNLPVDYDLSQEILAAEFGLPQSSAEAASMNSHLPACMAETMPVFVSGQARAVAYLALLELAAPGSIEASRGFGGAYQSGHIELSEDEAQLALQIASLPRDEVLSVLGPRWEDVTDPETDSAAIAEWFGLAPPEVVEASSYESMQCVCNPDGGVSCTSTEGS